MNRKPAVAGTFYPATQKELRKDLEELFENSLPKNLNNIRAIISPHAGYVFSGGVAASAFNQIDREKEYERVFIIASSHRSSFHGASIYCDGNFDMPYGQEPVDTQFGKFLCTQDPSLFTSNAQHHIKEHSIEVQLPFINFILKPTYKIVPILLGDVTSQNCMDIAKALEPYYNSENLFIISSDFSHYPSYEQARVVDKVTMEAIVSNNPQNLFKVLKETASKGIENLQTSLCGWSAVLVLHYLTQHNPFSSYHELEYKNSGDNTLYGEKESVVGYWAIAISQDIEVLHWIARRSIEEAISGNELAYVDGRDLKTLVLKELGVKKMPDSFMQKCGVFVTLKKRGKLRGCIGYVQSEVPLYVEVGNVAVFAACNDNRFDKVAPIELSEIEIEISILSPMRLIKDIEEIEMGKHGILIEKNGRSGLFLPQVGVETGWTLEEYLGHCARDKAGIGWDGWKEAQISIFTVTIV